MARVVNQGVSLSFSSIFAGLSAFVKIQPDAISFLSTPAFAKSAHGFSETYPLDLRYSL